MKNPNPDLLTTTLNIADELTTPGDLQDEVEHGVSGGPGLAPQLLDIARIADYYRQVHNPLATNLQSDVPENWDHLELLEVLGQGTYGVVYRALDSRLLREVALKVLPLDDHDDQTKALAEARRLASLKHPNIVTIFGAEIWRGQVGFWMELVTGHTLEDLIATHGPMDPQEAARIGSDIARALTAIHGAGLVHRDIKPANVMREYGGRTILMDLGTGTPLPGAASEDQEVAYRGTPMYCAPEILAGQPADISADIYSLGVLLDHLVTGSYPVAGKSVAEIMAAQQSGKVQAIRDRRSDLDEGFVGLIEKAAALDPQERYQSAGEVARALGQWQAKTVTVVLPRQKTQQSPKRARKYAWPLAALFLGVILVGALTRSWFLPHNIPGVQAEATLYLGSLNPPRSLSPGALVQPGDRLFLDFTATSPLHVYLINEDDSGHAYILYPLPGMDLANPLPRGTHRLPPSREGAPYSWTVSSAGGQEHFLIAASPEPISLLEDLLDEIPVAKDLGQSPLLAYPLSREQQAQLRGVGFVLPDPAAAERSSSSSLISELYKNLEQAREAGSIWVKRIDLANPR